MTHPDRVSGRSGRCALAVVLIAGFFALTSCSRSEMREPAEPTLPSEPVLTPGLPGTFDETAVKDPSIVFAQGAWHLFYTARGEGLYSLGYASAESLSDLTDAPRTKLDRLRGEGEGYAAAPQIFFFEPQGLWVLLYQTRDAHYQPVFSTTKTIAQPESWTPPEPLLQKDEEDKWIDFWLICDADSTYLFYTREHWDVMVRAAAKDKFPGGWGPARIAFAGVHEAVHVYKAAGLDRYDMIYELNQDGVRSFGLATASRLSGPWEKRTDAYLTQADLKRQAPGRWTDMVSHGEALRTGYNERLEYDAENATWLIQGLTSNHLDLPYPELPWRLGLVRSEKR